MRHVSYRTTGMRAQRKGVGDLPFGEKKLLKLRQARIHSRSSIANVQGAGVRRRLDQIEDDAEQCGNHFVRIQYPSPVVCGNSTVADAGGASSAPGRGLSA